MKLQKLTLARATLVTAAFMLAMSVVWSAHAQTVPVGSMNLSGSIAITNTFQSIQGQTNNRQGCAIQNNGTHTMYVYIGSGAPSTATSAQLSAGQSLICGVTGNTVAKDAISITGTSGDTFYANFQ